MGVDEALRGPGVEDVGAVEGSHLVLPHLVEEVLDDGAAVEVGHGVPVCQRVRGKPRSTLEVAGSGQRCVTTLPRV